MGKVEEIIARAIGGPAGYSGPQAQAVLSALDAGGYDVVQKEVMEKVYRALKGIYLDVTFMYEHGMIPYVFDDVTYVDAAAALKEIEE